MDRKRKIFGQFAAARFTASGVLDTTFGTNGVASADFGHFDSTGAVVWALSPQDVDSHNRFSDKNGGFKFPLLADTDKEVGRRYGVLGPVGFYRRSVFVIDADGVIRYAHRALSGLTFRPTEELVSAVAAAR